MGTRAAGLDASHDGDVALPPGLADAVRAAKPGYAVFDADGTLWREDVGEAFLRHLVALGLVKLADGTDPYAAYERAVARDRRTGYAYAAQLLAGLPAAQIQAEAARFALTWVPPRIIRSTSALLALCAGAGHIVCVVSASQIDIVRAAVIHAGIPWSRCAGMETELGPDGRYTAEMVEPITYGAGKVETAMARGFRPIAVAGGDSITGDLALLQAAAVPVVVAADGPTPLSAEAEKRGWFVLS